MKIKTLVRCRPNWTENSRDGSAVYMLAQDGWQLLGILRGSCGPHGQSTGIFAECKTTTPLAGRWYLMGRALISAGVRYRLPVLNKIGIACQEHAYRISGNRRKNNGYKNQTAGRKNRIVRRR